MAMTYEEMQARIAELEAKNAALSKAPGTRELSFKVSEKGGVSVYGLNARFPVTLYGDQWERLITALPRLQTFLTNNKGMLSSKPVKA